MSDPPDIEMKSATPSYEEVYARLHADYIARLSTSRDVITNILSRNALSPLTREDLQRAQHLAHGLAGSGATFGFPEVTSAGQIVDSMLDKMIKAVPADGKMTPDQFKELEKAMLQLSHACEDGLAKQDQDTRVLPTSEILRKSQQPFSVLVVDDDEHIADFLSMRLQQKGMQVVVARDGEAAMNHVQRSRPDLIVLDITMPRLGGHEVLRRLKQDPDLVPIPVLMLTAQADQKDVVGALHSGAMDYIIKPFSPDKLVARIEKILDAARYTVLVADNDPLILQLLDTKFRYAGFRIVLVEDGKRALDRIRKILPDLVILDRMMPGLEGLAVLKQMREEPDTADIPVIILSARKEERDIDLGAKMGAQKYMVKPFLPDDLIKESFRLLDERAKNKSA